MPSGPAGDRASRGRLPREGCGARPGVTRRRLAIAWCPRQDSNPQRSRVEAGCPVRLGDGGVVPGAGVEPAAAPVGTGCSIRRAARAWTRWPGSNRRDPRCRRVPGLSATARCSARRRRDVGCLTGIEPAATRTTTSRLSIRLQATCARRDSNPRPPAPEAGALSAGLRAQDFDELPAQVSNPGSPAPKAGGLTRYPIGDRAGRRGPPRADDGARTRCLDLGRVAPGQMGFIRIAR